MTSRVTNTRPVIDLDGDQPVMLNDLLRSVDMVEGEGGLAHVEMRFDNATHHDGVGINFAFEFSDTDALRLGTGFRVLFPARDPEAETDTPREVFSGRVSALEFVANDNGVPELVVLGEDMLMPWRMRRRTRVFEGKAIKDMVAELAQDSDLSNPVADYLGDEIVTCHQSDESDLAFLRRILADWDADVQVVDGTLQISPRADIQRGDVSVEWGDTLRSVRVAADLAHQRAQFSLSAYDHIKGTALHAKMATTALGPGDGQGAAAYLENFGTTHHHLSAAKVTNEAEAQAQIDAVGARASRRFVVAEGVCVGNPQIRVGTHLTLTGIGERFSNTYYVTSVRHCFDTTDGYRTEFEAECAFFKGEVAA